MAGVAQAEIQNVISEFTQASKAGNRKLMENIAADFAKNFRLPKGAWQGYVANFNDFIELYNTQVREGTQIKEITTFFDAYIDKLNTYIKTKKEQKTVEEDATKTTGNNTDQNDNKNEDDEEEKLKELQKKREQLKSEIEKIWKTLGASFQSSYNNERQAIIDKYVDLSNTVSELYANEKEKRKELNDELEKLSEKELAAFDEKKAKERAQARADIEYEMLQMTGDAQEKEKAQVTRHYMELIQKVEDFNEKLVEAGETRLIDTQVLYDKLKEETTRIDEGHTEETDIFGMTPDKWETLRENFNNVLQYINQISSIWGSLNQIQSNKEQAAFNKYKENNEKQKKLLNDRLDQGAISQEQYNARVANLDADLEKKRKKMQQNQAERQKKQQIFEATINTAAAIVEALPNIPLSILVGAAGAAQIAAIASQPVPEYAQGGFTKGDRIYRAGEKGREWIASNDMLMNPYTGPIIQMLDDVRQRRTPASIFAPAKPNVAEVVESMPAYSRGGYTAPARTETKVIQQNIPQTDTETANAMNRMARNIENLTVYMSDPKNRQAVINYNTLKRQNQEDELRNSLGRIK
jgi:DNA repair exonuclease SbcCD ATPase subunit